MTHHQACDIPDCGNRRCTDCGERLMCTGPEPAPRCPDHPTCVDCADDVVWCGECKRVLAEAAQDRQDDRAYEIARDQ